MKLETLAVHAGYTPEATTKLNATRDFLNDFIEILPTLQA